MLHEPHSLSGLLQAANKGDTAAYKQFLNALVPRLRAAAMSKLARTTQGPDEAEDVVQEVLLAIHLKRATWDERRPAEPWVWAILRYKLVDHLRRKGFRHFDDIADYEDVLAQPELAQSATDADCAALIGMLPEQQRTIVLQVSIEGRSAREVGGILGMSEGAVRIAFHRALKQLSNLYRAGGA